jgi:hypothetical protein
MNTERNGHESTSPVSPLPARTALDNYFLDARARLLDLAAFLDRIDRGEGGPEMGGDARVERIRQALQVLHDGPAGQRAEKIQQIFSLEYEPGWEIPQPRY